MNWGTKIIIVMAVFMAFILGLSLYMMGHNPELEEKDYYEKDLGYQQQLDARHNQADLKEGVKVEYISDKQVVQVEYPNGMKNISGTILFVRPSDARQDFNTVLKLNETNRQILSTGKLSPGLWRVKVEWKMNDKLFETRTYEFMLN